MRVRHDAWIVLWQRAEKDYTEKVRQARDSFQPQERKPPANLSLIQYKLDIFNFIIQIALYYTSLPLCDFPSRRCRVTPFLPPHMR